MIIDGKNVEIITEENFNLPSLWQVLVYLGTRYPYINLPKIAKDKALIGLIKNLSQSYIKRDISRFYSGLKLIVEQSIALSIQKHPEFILSDNFRIHLKYISDESKRFLMKYVYELSSIPEAYFEVNLSQGFIHEILTNDIESIEALLSHELFHHFDIGKILRLSRVGKRLEDLAKKENTNISINSSLIFACMYLITVEGPANFMSDLKTNRMVVYKTKYIRKIENLLKTLSANFKFITEKSSITFNQNAPFHEVSAMITGIIVLHYLFKQGNRYSVWIVFNTGLFGLQFEYRKSLNADKINELYGKKNFKLFFQDTDIDNIIYGILRKLSSISHIRFLKEYEQACKYLGISEPFFTLDVYSHYKNECWRNYQKLKAKHGFLK